jgi:plastocyanin
MSDGTLPVAIGLAAGIGFVILFSIIFVSHDNNNASHVSIVIIPKDAALASSGRNFEPATIKVVIGMNNTVRWVNEDMVPSSVVANNYDDIGFYNATEDALGNPTDQSLLNPHESFEYTFTKEGMFGYHSVPHPWMHGTVTVSSR